MAAYMRAHGGALPSRLYRIPEWAPGGGFALGSWVAQQKKGRGVTDARRAVLDATEGWSWARPKSEVAEELELHWDAMLAKAARYFVEKGEWPPARYSDSVDGSPVGRWVALQRTLYKGKDPRQPLSPARLAKLEATPGWLWEVKAGLPEAAELEAHWDAMLAKAAGYFVELGEWPPTRYEDPSDGSRVGRWVFEQRRLRRATGDTGLSPARISKLEATPGWRWATKAGRSAAELEAHWDDMLARVVRYFVEHDEKWPPARYVDPADGSLIGLWVYHQRQQYKGADPSRPLSPARISKLEAMPGWLWEVSAGPLAESADREARWDSMLAKAVRYFAKEGVWPPTMYEERADGKPMALWDPARRSPVGLWVYEQRQRYKHKDPRRAPLSPARIAKLEATPGWLW